jgi:hypothetical protein
MIWATQVLCKENKLSNNTLLHLVKQQTNYIEQQQSKHKTHFVELVAMGKEI